MSRTRTLAVSSLLFAAACTAGSPPTVPPVDPGPDGRPVTPTEQTAVSLGVSIMSTDAQGVPRLMRSLRPRAAAAGLAPDAAARDHVAALAPLWVQKARPMTLATQGTQRLRNGATVVRLAQQVDGVIVDQGELRVLMHPDGALAAVSGTLLPAVASPSFASSPREALEHALDQHHGAVRSRPAIAVAGDHAGWHVLEVAADPQLQVTDARARRVLASDGGTLTAAWEVEVIGNAAPDPLADPDIPDLSARRYLIADATGKILRDTDLTHRDAFVYRLYAEPTGVRRPLDGPLADFSPHPTGFPDGSAPSSFIDSNLVVVDAFNGPRDPWLPNNATTTSGNNANAFSDLDGTGTFTTGDVRPEVRSGRVLNYRYDTSLEPLATPDQIKAGVVSTFFLTNWMHDWWYDSGFTEATGNAQVDNYGRGGVANDPIIVLAQAGARVGARDNATMATPADGLSPRMRIFVFTSIALTSLTTAAGAITSEAFTAPPHTFEVTGVVALADDGVAPTSDACQPFTNVAGKIALIVFSGVCGSAATVNNARAAGAIGVILADGALDDPRRFGGSAAANLPGLAVGKTDGETLAAAVAAGPVEVTLQSAPSGVERDGDLDSGVSGHEWGHYLHLRLATCNGGQQCRGMGEGWGDFNGLLLQLREGDNRDGTFAQGSYADANGTRDAAYFSIRRFPYSRDRNKNDLSFRHIADDQTLPTHTPGGPNGAPNSEVHNAGEVWAAMLWEAFNVLIDQHGVPVARRRITDYVVAGLLLTPPNATYTEGRDGILAAASALDTDDMLLMSAAFAGRGAGSCAASPSNTVRTNNGVVESGTLAAKLAAGTATLADDVISRDNDGILEPGESGLLRVTLANGGPLAAEDVQVTATSANVGIQIGAPVRIPLFDPFSLAELTIPVRLLATAPPDTALTITIRIVGEQTCDRDGLTLVLTIPSGATATAREPTIAIAEPAAHADAALVSSVVSMYEAPAVSLRAADDAVCIMNDAP
jgi:large repetitive protein